MLDETADVLGLDLDGREIVVVQSADRGIDVALNASCRERTFERLGGDAEARRDGHAEPDQPSKVRRLAAPALRAVFGNPLQRNDLRDHHPLLLFSVPAAACELLLCCSTPLRPLIRIIRLRLYRTFFSCHRKSRNRGIKREGRTPLLRLDPQNSGRGGEQRALRPLSGPAL